MDVYQDLIMSRRNENTTKVFVGSLPAGVTTDDLRGLFAPYGNIVECDIANRCGFLHLEDKDLATKAIEELNNTNFMGGRISVEKGRVKPPNRGRRDGPGPMRGGRDRGGPYSRDEGYGRGPPRNGMGGYGGRDYPPYDRYGDFDRGMQSRGYGGAEYGMEERRPMYDDRRGYMGERRPYGPSNGYERQGYEHPTYPGYDDRGGDAGGYEDRRPLITDRRPLLDQQGPGPGAPRSMSGYDRSSGGNDMYSRRGDAGTKSGGYGERESLGSYGSGNATGASGYSTSTGYGGNSGVVSGSYGGSGAGSGYGSAPGAGYGASTYGDSRGSGAAAGGGYGDNRAGGYAGMPSGGNSYGSGGAVGGGYGSGGGYGDSYGSNRGGGSYDTAYPLPQQRNFASNSGGPAPRRDLASGSGRRY